MDNMRKQKNEREMMNEAHGIKVDVDFQVMVENNMQNVPLKAPVSHNLKVTLITILIISIFQLTN